MGQVCEIKLSGRELNPAATQPTLCGNVPLSVGTSIWNCDDDRRVRPGTYWSTLMHLGQLLKYKALNADRSTWKWCCSFGHGWHSIINQISYYISYIRFHISIPKKSRMIYSCIIYQTSYQISYIRFHISDFIYQISYIRFHISDFIYRYRRKAEWRAPGLWQFWLLSLTYRLCMFY